MHLARGEELLAVIYAQTRLALRVVANADFGIQHFAGRGIVRQRDAVELEIVGVLLGAHSHGVHRNAKRSELGKFLLAQRAAVLRAIGNEHDAGERRRRAGLQHGIQRIANVGLRARRRNFLELLEGLDLIREAEQPHTERFAERIQRPGLQRGYGILKARVLALTVRHARGCVHDHSHHVLALTHLLHEQHGAPENDEHHREQRRLQQAEHESARPSEMMLA